MESLTRCLIWLDIKGTYERTDKLSWSTLTVLFLISLSLPIAIHLMTQNLLDSSIEESTEIEKLILGTAHDPISSSIFLPSSEKMKFSEEDAEISLSHAKELLGKYYSKSIVHQNINHSQLDQFLKEQIQEKLKGNWKKYASDIYEVILTQSRQYGFDPLFLIAVIENESSFQPKIRGSFGEIGLMQLKPDTAQWIAKKYDLEWKGPNSLYNPIQNIIYGSAYLAHLREKFKSHGRLYLAAYNMGSRNVKKTLKRKIWPKTYPANVMQRYIKLYTELKLASL